MAIFRDDEHAADLADRSIGECECESGATYARAVDAHRLFYVEWLGVSDEFQGRARGAYLLLQALLRTRHFWDSVSFRAGAFQAQ